MQRRNRFALATLSTLALVACKPKVEEPAPSSSPPEPEVAAPQSSAGGDLMSGANLLKMSSMLSELGKPGLYDAPRSSAEFSKNKPHVLTMGLSGSISELENISLFSTKGSTPLRMLQDRLRELAERDDLKSLLLRVGDLGISMATAQELRASLLAFKGEGKRGLHCHTESASNIQYYLLSACDSIAIAPTGGVVISGVAAMPMHLKGLLDKLGIKADFLHVGDYKGAAEPLTLDRPSEAMNTTIAGILDQSYATLVEGIASGRSLDVAVVRDLIDTAMFTAPEAVLAKLVDEEITYEAYRSKIAGELPWKRVGVEEAEEPGIARIMQLMGLQPHRRDGADHIAVVYAVGSIIDGKGDGVLGARGEIASRTLVAALRALTEAESVKGVVLRVDSGGGSALASELIWHAMNDLKAVKPVVVSMGGVAASGGYYISAGANRIYADENTLTGSIGVVGGKLAIGGALEKLGVTSFPVGRGKRSLMWSSLGAWNADQRAAIQKMMEDIYKVFVQRVADGRGKTYEEIHAIAQGRVWTGKAALENGLVDEIGGLDAALAHVTELAGMESPGDLEVYPPKPTLVDFVSSYANGVSATESSVLGEVRLLLGDAAAVTIANTLSQVHSFRDANVQTTMLLPVVWQ